LRAESRPRPTPSADDPNAAARSATNGDAAARGAPGASGSPAGTGTLGGEPGRSVADGNSGSSIALEQAIPRTSPGAGVGPGLAILEIRPPLRNLTEIPKVYQPRLAPDRPSRAQQAGASAASELAVERALDWLARHQDPDGRWDAAIARY